ncbi:MAG: DNA replication/repair protein RecF, partial [Proteobacteria bacterium]
YRSLSLTLSPDITVFTGRNGIGKTTILEAIALLGSGRSFRSARNLDFVQKKEEAAVIKGEASNSGLISDLEVRIYPQSKKIFVDNKLAKSAKQLIDLLPTIVFSPADHRIIEGDSTDRKQFLNRAAINVDWEYQEDLNNYNKALQQRNRILKDQGEAIASSGRSALIDTLAIWDEQLVHHGSRLIARRNFYLSDLKPFLNIEYGKISQSSDQCDLAYQPFGEENEPVPCDTEAEIKNYFAQRLRDSLRRDCFSGSSQVGPHKDEIQLTLNGNKVKFYGSQGEKRTCALALRLGELALFRAKLRRMPILLFDDVSSELDSVRRQSLVQLLQEEKTQVLITATELPSSLMDDVGKTFEQRDLSSIGDRQAVGDRTE